MRPAGSDTGYQNLRLKLKRFDWATAFAGYWAVAGLYVDAAWHIRHDVDTFFTWAHAVLYSGLVLLLGLMLARYFSSKGASLEPRSAADPYRWSEIGVLVFLAGGIADTINHLFFGFEAGFDSLLSPTHEVIGIGVLLIVSGPVRAAVTEMPRPDSLGSQLPCVLSMAAIVELLHWGTQVFFRIDAARELGTVVPHELTPDALTLSTIHFFQQGGSLIAVVLQSLLVMGPAIYLVRNFSLRPGAFVIFVLLANGLIAVTHSITWLDVAGVLAASALAGFAADMLAVKASVAASRAAQGWFAFLVPAVYTAALLLFTVLFMGGTWWDPLFAAGAVFYSGLFSLLLSFVAGAPRPQLA